MADRPMTLGDVLERLRAEGLLDAQGADGIAEELRLSREAPSAPWFVKVLFALGACVAAASFFVFLACAGLFPESAGALLVMGLVLVAGAAALRFVSGHVSVAQLSLAVSVFGAQLALAVSVAGHAMALVGAAGVVEGPWRDMPARVALASLILCLVLYPLHRDTLHRFLSCLLVAVATTAWLLASQQYHMLHVLVLLEAAAIAVCFTCWRLPQAFRPMAYALACGLPLTVLLVVLVNSAVLRDALWFWEETVETPAWPSSAVLALWLIWLYLWAAGGVARWRQEPVLVAVIVTVALGAFTSPGILAGAGLLVLGFGRRDSRLLGLGLAFFPVFLVLYYYNLDLDLATKSYVLAGSGGILLVVRALLGWRPWAREGAS